MSEDLNLFYFTKLVVVGSLNMGGHNIGLSYNTILEVGGDVTNVGKIQGASSGCCMSSQTDSILATVQINGSLDVTTVEGTEAYFTLSVGGNLTATTLSLGTFVHVDAVNIVIAGVVTCSSYCWILGDSISVGAASSLAYCSNLDATSSFTSSSAFSLDAYSQLTAATIDFASDLTIGNYAIVTSNGSAVIGGDVKQYPYAVLTAGTVQAASNWAVDQHATITSGATTINGGFVMSSQSAATFSSTLNVAMALMMSPVSIERRTC